MQNDLYYHRQIDFHVLRETKKAVLVKVINFNCYKLKRYLEVYEIDIINPLEMWFPKSWFKKRGDKFWIWEQGLISNTKKLIEKRTKNKDDSETKATAIELDQLEKDINKLEYDLGLTNKKRTLN